MELRGRRQFASMHSPSLLHPRDTPAALDDLGVGQVVRRVIAQLHRDNAERPIEGADEYGVFTAPGLPPLNGAVATVVVDANVLRNDVVYACRNRQRTVLVSAANSGAIRLFAASHVIEEVREHGRRWANESAGVTPQAFNALWREEYLPLIRVVDDRDLSPHMLALEERRRLHELEAEDPDDIPSTILCLTIGGFFLSEDPAALQAVYGEDVDTVAHHEWVQTLKAGGSAGELGNLIFTAGMVPLIAGAGLLATGRWILKRVSLPTLAAIGSASTALITLHRPAPQTRHKLFDILADVGAELLYAYALYQDSYLSFRRETPVLPGWTALCHELEAQWLMRRACMWLLARSAAGAISVADQVQQLEELGLAIKPETLTSGLMTCESFLEVAEGRFQLGRPEWLTASVSQDLPGGPD